MAFTGFDRALASVNLVLTSFTECLPSLSYFYWVIAGFTEYYCNLPSFTWFYWCLIRFYGFHRVHCVDQLDHHQVVLRRLSSLFFLYLFPFSFLFFSIFLVSYFYLDRCSFVLLWTFVVAISRIGLGFSWFPFQVSAKFSKFFISFFVT